MFKTIVGFIASIGNEDGLLTIISVNKLTEGTMFIPFSFALYDNVIIGTFHQIITRI